MRILWLLLLVSFIGYGQKSNKPYYRQDPYQLLLTQYQRQYPTAKWVDCNYYGATANGGFTTPYKTIAAAYAGASTGGTIILKRGLYTEAGALDINGKVLTFIGVGQVTWKHATDGTAYLVYLRTDNCSFKNIIFDAIKTDGVTKRYNAILYTKSGATLTSCTIKNTTDVAFCCSTNTGMVTFTNCTFIDNAKVITASVNGLTMNNCYIDASCGTSGNALSNSAGVTTVTGTVCNSSAYAIFVNHSSTGNLEVVGNRCKNQIVDATKGSGIIKVNSNYSTSTLTTLRYFISISSTAAPTDIEIKGNNLYHSGVAFGHATNNRMIYVQNQASMEISGNEIETVVDANHSLIVVSNSTVTATKCMIKNNIGKSRNSTGYQIKVGEESSSAADNLLSVAVIENNLLYGSQYYANDYGNHATHNIFTGFTKNVTIRYNKIIGGARGIIIKDNNVNTNTAGGIYGNVVVDPGVGIFVQNSEGVRCFNNVVAITKNTGYIPGSSTIYGILFKDESGGNCNGGLIKNNITAVLGTGFNAAVKAFAIGTITGGTLDYNCAYAEGGAGAYNGYADFAAWQLAGFDANGLNTDPLLEDVSTFKCYPASALSPIVGTGVDIGGSPYKDILSKISSVIGLQLIDQDVTGWYMGAYGDY